MAIRVKLTPVVQLPPAPLIGPSVFIPLRDYSSGAHARKDPHLYWDYSVRDWIGGDRDKAWLVCNGNDVGLPTDDPMATKRAFEARNRGQLWGGWIFDADELDTVAYLNAFFEKTNTPIKAWDCPL